MSTERFLTAEVTSPQDYLDCARAAEQYVRTFLEKTEDGIRYVAEGFYTGLAGITVALLQLYRLEVPGTPVIQMIDDPYRRN